MASPLHIGKQSVDLVNSAPGSKIRRDPVPAAKEITFSDPERHDTRTVVLGVTTFTILLTTALIGIFNSFG